MLAAARVAASQDRKSLAAAYLLQSELALLRKENRLGLKAAMRSRDLSRKTQTKKGEARQVLPSLPLPATSTVLPVCPLDPREREREREREGEREERGREVVLCVCCLGFQASALLQLCSAYCARGELKRGHAFAELCNSALLFSGLPVVRLEVPQ